MSDWSRLQTDLFGNCSVPLGASFTGLCTITLPSVSRMLLLLDLLFGWLIL